MFISMDGKTPYPFSQFVLSRHAMRISGRFKTKTNKLHLKYGYCMSLKKMTQSKLAAKDLPQNARLLPFNGCRHASA
jgi:hypothetical protein